MGGGGGKAGGGNNYTPPPAPVTPEGPTEAELEAQEKARQAEASELAARRQMNEMSSQNLLGGSEDELKTKKPTLLGGSA